MRAISRRPVRVVLLLGIVASADAAPPPGACPGGNPLAGFDLAVQPANDGDRVSLRSVTRLDGGSRLVYTPRELYGNGNGDAQIALITIPTTPSGVLGVLESHKASEAAEWVIPSRAAAIALVYGPQGLSLQKLADLMRRDPELIKQLALYAEKSAQTELLMEAVTAWERNGSAQGLEAALQGLSLRSGVAFPVLNRSATTDQQALTLMRALYPAISTIDPLAPNSAQRMQQSAGLAASVAGLFFGNTMGLASAGGAMFLNLRSLFFPGSEFRTALAQQMTDTSVLCAKREVMRSRTRLVYLWAWRIQGAPAPRVEGLPYRANLGVPEITIPIKGANLESVRAWSAAPAEVEYDSARVALTVKLPRDAKKGDRFDLRLEIEDSPAPIVLPGAIEVLDPRPVVLSVQPSLPRELSLPLRDGEIPANASTAVSIRARGAGLLPSVHLECTDPSLTLKKLSIRSGEQTGLARLTTVGDSGLFLSFEAGVVGHPPCMLGARVETSDGLSDPITVGRVVRLPRIDKFSLTPELISENAYAGWIEGEELELIERTGWNADRGLPVAEPPSPVANQGSRQRLRIAMPWPPPAPRAPLFVWLRGEQKGRRSVVAY